MSLRSDIYVNSDTLNPVAIIVLLTHKPDHVHYLSKALLWLSHLKKKSLLWSVRPHFSGVLET